MINSAHVGDAKVFDTPFELNAKLIKDDGHPLEDPTVFRCLVGSLLYLTITRLDISHVVRTVSQFVSNPHKSHLAAVLRILRHLKGTLAHGLFYPSTSSLQLSAYPTLTKLVVLILVGLLQNGACSSVTLLYLANVKTILHCPSVLPKLSIDPCP